MPEIEQKYTLEQDGRLNLSTFRTENERLEARERLGRPQMVNDREISTDSVPGGRIIINDSPPQVQVQEEELPAIRTPWVQASRLQPSDGGSFENYYSAFRNQYQNHWQDAQITVSVDPTPMTQEERDRVLSVQRQLQADDARRRELQAENTRIRRQYEFTRELEQERRRVEAARDNQQPGALTERMRNESDRAMRENEDRRILRAVNRDTTNTPTETDAPEGPPSGVPPTEWERVPGRPWGVPLYSYSPRQG